MSFLLTPHTPEWFAALDSFDPEQASVVRQVLKHAGRTDVCGLCGDPSAKDYQAIPRDLTIHPASAMRLCDSCRELRYTVLKETHAPLKSDA